MQYAHNDYDITDFHGALLDIISVMNQPLRDEQILQAAGVQLEQMLFPLLVAVGRHGPVGVVELADHLGARLHHRQPPGEKTGSPGTRL
ncbi:putative regulatory protein MarR [Klebsiella pneumoniae]|nr:putative regulatory protein MarR [Klebsiella pneumoniae]